MLRFIKKTILGLFVTVLAFGLLGNTGYALEAGSDLAVERLNEFAAMVKEEVVMQHVTKEGLQGFLDDLADYLQESTAAAA